MNLPLLYGHCVVFRMVSVVPEVKCHETSMCNYTVRDLTPSETYALYVTVRRQGDKSDGQPSPIVHVKTKCSGNSC